MEPDLQRSNASFHRSLAATCSSLGLEFSDLYDIIGGGSASASTSSTSASSELLGFVLSDPAAPPSLKRALSDQHQSADGEARQPKVTRSGSSYLHKLLDAIPTTGFVDSVVDGTLERALGNTQPAQPGLAQPGVAQPGLAQPGLSRQHSLQPGLSRQRSTRSSGAAPISRENSLLPPVSRDPSLLPLLGGASANSFIRGLLNDGVGTGSMGPALLDETGDVSATLLPLDPSLLPPDLRRETSQRS